MASKVRKSDEVVIISGRDKGKVGTVLEILKNDRVRVSGVNILKKHQKPMPALNRAGGILEREFPLHISNISLYNPETKKGDRVGFRFEGEKKIRFFKSNGTVVPSRLTGHKTRRGA